MRYLTPAAETVEIIEWISAVFVRVRLLDAAGRSIRDRALPLAGQARTSIERTGTFRFDELIPIKDGPDPVSR